MTKSMKRERAGRKKTSPAISIIVPVFCEDAYLDRCVQSILAQTFENFELILIDDGSPDRCPEKCDWWAHRDPRICVIHQENKGAASARNRGLEVAAGNYIGFVDSDDWIEKDMYHILYQAVTDMQADMAVCGLQIEKGRFGRSSNEKNDSTVADSLVENSETPVKWNRTDLLERFFRVHGEPDPHGIWNCLIRANVLNGYHFPEGKINEDIDLSFHLAAVCTSAVYVPRMFYHYYRNSSGVTNSRFSAKRLDLLELWDGIGERVLQEMPEYGEVCRMNCIRARFTLLSQMALNGYDHSDPEMRIIKKQLKAEVRAAYRDLMRWRMPVSRKILLTILIL